VRCNTRWVLCARALTWLYHPQDTYQQTHPVLFSDRALYVVVYNLRAGSSVPDLTRHLMNVTVRCKDAPILVVGTHSDEVGMGSPLRLAALKAKFPQVCPCVLVFLAIG
jgi:hypothetical protein